MGKEGEKERGRRKENEKKRKEEKRERMEKGETGKRKGWRKGKLERRKKKGEGKRKNERISLNTVLFHPQNRYCAYHSLHDSNLPWNSLAHLYNRIISKMSFDILPIAMSPLICMNL